jgi:uncharacterized membrane protein YhaH (DUF805 family)
MYKSKSMPEDGFYYGSELKRSVYWYFIFENLIMIYSIKKYIYLILFFLQNSVVSNTTLFYFLSS